MEAIEILTSLDDWYDTRFSALCSKGIDRGLKAIELGYTHRQDESCLYEALGVDADGWDAFYRKRDNNILARSSRTKMYKLMMSIVEDAAMTPRDYVNTANVAITINEYPYTLPAKFRMEQERIMRHMLGPVRIRWINLPPKRLTPRYLVANFSHYLLYNWNEWVLAQETIPDTERANLLNLTFILPRTLRNRPTEAELSEYYEKVSGRPIHDMIEFALGPGYTVRAMSVEYWNFPVQLSPTQPPSA